MKGILLMAYGGPSSEDKIEEYYVNIRRGRQPSPQQLNELVKRYKAIGGISPLPDITFRQGKKLQLLLNNHGRNEKVFVAMKHSSPYIKDVIEEIGKLGINEVLGLVLVPYFSYMSTYEYFEEVNTSILKLGTPIHFSHINQWYDNQLFVKVWTNHIRQQVDEETQLIFTAHSLPKKILLNGDPYEKQLLEGCKLIADSLNINDWKLAFQSASNTGEEWLGPDIINMLEQMKDMGRRILIAPLGFVADNLEILYDLDIKIIKEMSNMRIKRTSLPNDSDDFIECLYSVVIS